MQRGDTLQQGRENCCPLVGLETPLLRVVCKQKIVGSTQTTLRCLREFLPYAHMIYHTSGNNNEALYGTNILFGICWNTEVSYTETKEIFPIHIADQL